MLNPRLAGRYAKSLVDLAVERNQLDAVYNDMEFLKAVLKSSRELVVLLKSPVVSSDKKNTVVKAITAGKVSELTSAFNQLLISKNREFYLPEIVDAFLDQYKKIKGIHKIKLTTAAPVSEELKQTLVKQLKADSSFEHVELESVVKEELIGGFVLEFNNNLVDASIQRELRELKKEFANNTFVQQIR